MKVDNNEQRSSSSGLSNENIKMEYQDVKDREEASFECVEISSDEESDFMPNRYSFRDRNAEKSLFNDNHLPESSSEDDKEGSSNRKLFESWTTGDRIRLIYIVENVGRKWTMIVKHYKSYLRNKSVSAIKNQYYKIKQNKTLFQNLLEKSKKVKDVNIVNESNPTSSPESWVKWSEMELTYLVYGAAKFEGNKDEYFKKYKNVFDDSRTSKSLISKYYRLKKDPKKFLYFQKKAALLFKKHQ
jgi:hypothetical protein